jgi:hypothetical protein
MSTAELCAGLPFDARSVRRMRWVPWDDYCTLVERVAAAAGGADRLEDLLARSFHLSAPGWRSLAGALIHPRRLYKAMWKANDLFPTVHSNHHELGDGRLRGIARLVPAARPCLAFFRGSVGVIRGLPGHLGLPVAEVEVEELTDRSLVVLVRPPASRTLFARARSLFAPEPPAPAPPPRVPTAEDARRPRSSTWSPAASPTRRSPWSSTAARRRSRPISPRSCGRQACRAASSSSRASASVRGLTEVRGTRAAGRGGRRRRRARRARDEGQAGSPAGGSRTS